MAARSAVRAGGGGQRLVPPLPDGVRVLRPGRNLGFAGGANAGIAEAKGPIVLILNPDAVPEEGALERLLEGFAAHPDAAGLAPRLVGPAGEPQWAWQLRRLPSPWSLLLHALPLGGEAAIGRSLPAGAGRAARRGGAGPAAVGARGGRRVRRRVLSRLVRGRGPRPAFRQAHLPILYWPAARFRHRLGSTVPRLGYGPFLWIYYRNLIRYLAKHHGRVWALAARVALVLGMLLRLCSCRFRRPRRAASRREAFSGILAVLAGTVSGFKRMVP